MHLQIKKDKFDYHHCSAKRDNIAKAATIDCLLLYLRLNSCRYISPARAMVSLISQPFTEMLFRPHYLHNVNVYQCPTESSLP